MNPNNGLQSSFFTIDHLKISSDSHLIWLSAIVTSLSYFDLLVTSKISKPDDLTLWLALRLVIFNH